MLPIGANGSGKSKLMTAAEIRSAASVYSQAQTDAAFVALAGSYTNPSWIVSIPNTKVTGLGTLSTQSGTFSGISSGTNTGDQDLSSYLTSATAAATYAPLTRTLNTLALSADQTFAVGTTGTDFAIESSGTVHTFNIPNASDTARGLISTGSQIIAGPKDFLDNISASNLSGNNTGDQNLSDYLTIYDAGITYLTQATFGYVTLNGLSISGSQEFSVLNDGTDFTIESNANTHFFKMPDASEAARGLINTGTQTIAGAKTFSEAITASNLSGTNTGDQTITLTGDVTGTGIGSFAATIASGAVSLAKMANVATGTVFYRKTAATGVPEVQTLATLKTDLGLTGTNSGDNAVNTLYSSLVSNATHTGDVTGATTLTIANDAVTYAKMQNVSATDRLLGRSTSGAGNVEEITCTAAARSILDDATVSDMINTLGGATSTGTGGLVRLNAPTLQGGMLVEAGGNFTTNYGAPAQLRARRAQGTQGSPAQATNGIQLGIIGAQGMNDALAFAGYTAYISFNAAQNITTTGCGGYYNFYTTPVGSLTEVMRAWIGAAGNIGIGVFAAEPSTLLTINGDLIRIMTAKTPASSAAAGNAGEFCWDTTYFYGCTAANTWKRIAWTTF